jgi:CheY-like chemotaxis protein
MNPVNNELSKRMHGNRDDGRAPVRETVSHPPRPADDAHSADGLKNLSVASCKVMVVYNQDIESQMVAKIFARFGYGTTEVLGSPEALIYATRSHYHLVFTDLEMPELDGFQLAQRIKLQSPRTKTVIMAKENRFKFAGYKIAGVDAWLFKPFKITDLSNVIRSLNLPNSFNACARIT